jgi:hypothetical protein
VVAGTNVEGRRQVSEQREPRLGEDGRPESKQGGKPASDPVTDFQRWLMKAGAKSMANQVADNVRRSLGQQSHASKSGDVWDTATTEPPQDEPLECQWCPVCQAARRLRESGPGLGAKISDAGGILASMAQDAFSAFDQLMKSTSERPAPQPPATIPVRKPDDAAKADQPAQPDRAKGA